MSRESIARVLKEKRRASKMSVEEVADKLKTLYQIEISAKSLYSYESGHRQPDADLLLALCNIYGITDILQEFSFPEYEPVGNTKNTTDEYNEITKEEITKLLYDVVIKLGWIKSGEELTQKQIDILKAIVILLESGYSPKS